MSVPVAVTKKERKEATEFGLMRRFSREMDRLFEDFGFKPMFFERTADEPVWAPDVEIFEQDGKLLVRADLPGMKKDDVKVNVVENLLTIEGERKQELETKRENYYRSERSYGTFFRSLPLPEGVKMDQIQATFKDGVLEVTMPLAKAEKKTTMIEVKAA